jgi:hypothetical protein
LEFLNLRRTHKYRNLPLGKQLSSYFLAFHEKEIFPWERRTYKIGGAPPA